MYILQVRKQVGIPEDAFCYTALLKAAAKEQNPARTEALFDRAWQNGIRGAPIFNVLISQHTSAGQIKVGSFALPVTCNSVTSLQHNLFNHVSPVL